MMRTVIWFRSGLARLALLTALIVILPNVILGLSTAHPSFADEADWVGLARVSPAPVPGIDAGRTHRFEVEVNYRLESAESGLLVVCVFEDSSDKTAKASSEPVKINKGSGTATLEVTYGAPWQDVSSVMLGAVLLRDEQTVLKWAMSPAIPVNPSADRVLFDQAVEAFREGSRDEALAKMTAAIELAPKVANYYHWRGDMRASTGRYMEAIADYSKTLELAPLYRPSLVNRSIVHMWLGNWQTAIEGFDAVIDSGATDNWVIWAHRGRGVSNVILGRFAPGAADLQRYLDLRPQATDAEEVTGWIDSLNKR